MSFRKKVYVFFGLILSLFLVSSGLSYNSMSEIFSNSESVYFEDLDVLEKVLQADRDLHQALVAERSYFLTQDSGVRSKLLESHKENIQQAKDRGAAVLKRSGNNEEITQQYEHYKANLQKWERVSSLLLSSILKKGILSLRNTNKKA